MKRVSKASELAAKIQRDPRWALVQARDPSADGKFYYSVRTTGVYCRPACPARLAKPENIQFHATRAEAEQAGFRPCKRCKPDQPPLKERYAAIIAEVCRHMETDETLALDALSSHAGMSPFHFHRVFKEITGLTPKTYVTAYRAKRVRMGLDQNRTVTAAIFDAGYNSSSRFYAKSVEMLGMTPSKYRAGGREVEIRFAIGECSLGSILVAMSDRGICSISLGDDPELLVHELQDRFPKATLIGGDPQFEEMIAKVVGFVEAPAIGLDLPLDIRGTAFQQRAWQALREIPAGTTVSYTELANRIGSPNAVRAVAGACAANTLAVAIPCHRVVRSDGSLSATDGG